jgi:XapX domain-containing protein
MAIHLTRPREQRVTLGPALASRRPSPKTGRGLVRLAFGSLLVGLLLGLLFSWQQATSPATALLLGGSILAWAMLSFGAAPPK